ncbi:MAG TPA: tetratricopeptide repeat protein [Terriglobales bacterium]|nr:tetratricopeptide repeat protein [Terriglobales bacterium]
MTVREKKADNWTSIQAYTLAVVCLLVGIAGGWFVRGSQSPASTPIDSASPVQTGTAGTSAKPTPEQMRHMADKQAEPLLAELKSSPDSPALLANIGNIYYDTQQFPSAVDFYRQALKVAPDNVSVRTDMATAYWYMGDADTAIAEFKTALSYDPHTANALFNLGVVLWQGKMDVKGALATWQKLLDTNPNYQNKDKLLELMAQVKKHSSLKPGTQTKTLPE